MESAEIISAINNQTIVTIVSILGITFVVGGAAIAWLRSDIKRVENKSETAHEEIRGHLCDIRETLAKLSTDVDWLKHLAQTGKPPSDRS